MIVPAGVQLREARESLGLSVEDVAARLKVPVRYVHAMEQGDMAGLPEPTFVRGYVKAYAKVVGLDAEPLVAQLAPVEVKAPKQLVNVDTGVSSGSVRRPAAVRMPNFRGGSRRRYGAVLAIAGGVAVLALVAVGVAALFADRAPAPPAVATAVTVPAPVTAVPAIPEGTSLTVEVPLPGVPAPVAAPGAPPAVASAASAASAAGGAPVPMPAATVTAAAPAAAAAPASAQDVPRRGLHIRFRGASWVEVRDADNLVLHTSNQVAGGELTLDGKPPLSVTFNDASAADVWYNGAPQIDRSGRGRVNRMIVGQAAR